MWKRGRRNARVSDAFYPIWDAVCEEFHELRRHAAELGTSAAVG